MIIALIITLVALVTAIIAIIAAKEIIWDDSKSRWNKLNRKGYVVIVCAMLMVVLPLVQYIFQSKQDEQKEKDRKTEETARDHQLRMEYEASANKQLKNIKPRCCR